MLLKFCALDVHVEDARLIDTLPVLLILYLHVDESEETEMLKPKEATVCVEADWLGLFIVIVGAIVSTTVISVLFCFVFPAASVTVILKLMSAPVDAEIVVRLLT